MPINEWEGLILGDRDEYYMRQALLEAQKGGEQEEVPIGAVIVSNDRIIARAHNLTERLKDVTAHAEMLAITSAAQALGGKYLTGCTLYVTVEPCPMCAGALGWSKIGRIVYGASDSKRGYSCFCSEATSPLHPKTKITSGVLADKCGEIMQYFFRRKRRKR
ncbi:MAG: nucleoside deaminase [Muribaculaceae bacterium]|nr:nucleoside deaminase [Muribaculaceae bacterium]